MAYLTKQIQNLVNDSVNDALGANASTISELDTSDVVSLGKAISQFDAFEGFYKALTNRIVKTVYFVRTYEGSKRSVLRDEHEYGAFVQKVIQHGIFLMLLTSINRKVHMMLKRL